MQRSEANPILTRRDVPDVPPRVVDATSVFNPGAIFFGGRHVLLLRVQTRGRETVLMVAESDDGVRFDIRPEIVEIEGLETVEETIYHVYDPRLTRIGDTVYIVFAGDTDDGCKLGMARTGDFRRFELIGFGGGESRNGVLLPEKRDGHFRRLERPNLVARDDGVTTGDEIILAESDDLVTWRPRGPVMGGRLHYWDELIGSGPPPVRVREGWLHVYHGVATHFASVNIYQTGVVLLDADDPRRVIARSRDNILEPRVHYELTGQVPNVVFVSGMIVDGHDHDVEREAAPDRTVRLYYGAADTVVGLAVTTIGELLDACRT